ncbi:hypothetical protein V8F06_013604 [Rhypophila decipiens]
MHAVTLIRLFMGITTVVIAAPVDDPPKATKTIVTTLIVSSPILSDVGNLPILTSTITTTQTITEISTTKTTTKTRTTTKKAGFDGCYPSYCYGAPCSFADCFYYCVSIFIPSR